MASQQQEAPAATAASQQQLRVGSSMIASRGNSAKENQAMNSGSFVNQGPLDDYGHKEESLWPVFHKLKGILETPTPEKKPHHVTYDDSKR